MKIWVDADACPVVIWDIVFQSAARTETETTLITNPSLTVPRSRFVKRLPVPAGFDVADKEIAKRGQAGDLAITSDIPLAAEVIENDAVPPNPRGELHTKENIGARLNRRDFIDTMRAGGVITGGPQAMSQRDRQAFANQPDTLLASRQALCGFTVNAIDQSPADSARIAPASIPACHPNSS